jgi:hypothetical protein
VSSTAPDRCAHVRSWGASPGRNKAQAFVLSYRFHRFALTSARCCSQRNDTAREGHVKIVRRAFAERENGSVRYAYGLDISFLDSRIIYAATLACRVQGRMREVSCAPVDTLTASPATTSSHKSAAVSYHYGGRSDSWSLEVPWICVELVIERWVVLVRSLVL